MSPRWRDRLWKLALFALLLAATVVLLAPDAPAVGPSFPFVDKLQHLVLFAGLALVASRAYADKPRWGIAVALVFYGACIELAQARVGRHFELLDLAADALGALAVYLAPRVRQPSSAPPASRER
ncbi:MAG TPA: VanZ family protein [Candidatus Thermoplasmatota archaeon]|nr:VanZ family protein [Candidatus Thermoplasmatota archaeon]